ncbi:MAG TPA: LLM class F420-dependent oxidoreductase [Candidatus Binataceae bacterium]|nr:LLM class F420-dependent oxidoreductase [Candidatus Binataceae bacterium]
MDVGILVATTARTGDVAEVARTAEAAGYESLWIPEHPVIPVGFKTSVPGGGKLPEHYGRWVDPFVALTIAATATKRIKLGTGICLLPEREPLITAKTIASLDLYSGGRVILGVGAGWLREETEAMGANFGSRWKRLRETTEAMRVAWTEPEPSYNGDLVRFPALRCEPKPVQKPYPPILLGAHGPKAIERVARTYDGWMPLVQNAEAFKCDVATLRKLTASNGRNPAALQITAIVDPREDGLSVEELRAYKEAGASRVMVFSQKLGIAMADGAALDLVKRYAPVVERAHRV